MAYDVRINVRVPRELHDRLAELAVAARYDLSDELRRALWRHVEAQNDGEPAGTAGPRVASAVQERRYAETR